MGSKATRAMMAVRRHRTYCRFTISMTVYVTVTLCIVNDAVTVLSVTCDLLSTSDTVGVA